MGQLLLARQQSGIHVASHHRLTQLVIRYQGVLKGFGRKKQGKGQKSAVAKAGNADGNTPQVHRFQGVVGDHHCAVAPAETRSAAEQTVAVLHIGVGGSRKQRDLQLTRMRQMIQHVYIAPYRNQSRQRAGRAVCRCIKQSLKAKGSIRSGREAERQRWAAMRSGRSGIHDFALQFAVQNITSLRN